MESILEVGVEYSKTLMTLNAKHIVISLIQFYGTRNYKKKLKENLDKNLDKQLESQQEIQC